VAGHTHYTAFQIAEDQVPTPQTGFAAVINPTDIRFRSPANGGNVFHPNGIRPYLDPGLTQPITYKLVPGSYSATLGTFEMWLGIRASEGLPVYFAYGDPALTADGSGNPFDSSVKIHSAFPDGTTLDVTDLTGQNNGTGINSPTATTGKIGGAVQTDGGAFGGAHQYVDYGAVYTGTLTKLSWCMWARRSLSLNFQHFLDIKNNLLTFQINSGEPTDIACFFSVPADFVRTTTTPNAQNTTYFLYVVYDGTQGTDAARLKFYVDGVSQATTGVVPTSITAADTEHILLSGSTVVSSDPYFGGWQDEFEFAPAVARSQDWVTTAYNNQNAPNTFWIMGPEVPLKTLMGQAIM
jgi:hypothetical protein